MFELAQKQKFWFILTITLYSFLLSNSRIAFSRPNSLIRSPSIRTNSKTSNFYVGFSSETINSTNLTGAELITGSENFQHGFVHIAPVASKPENSVQ